MRSRELQPPRKSKQSPSVAAAIRRTRHRLRGVDVRISPRAPEPGCRAAAASPGTLSGYGHRRRGHLPDADLCQSRSVQSADRGLPLPRGSATPPARLRPKAMPCRSSVACGERRPRERARSTSRSKPSGSAAGGRRAFSLVPAGEAVPRFLGFDRPSAFAFRLAWAGLGATVGTFALRRPLSGTTSTIALRNRSASLAMAFRVALTVGRVYTARHGQRAPYFDAAESAAPGPAGP